MEKKTTYLILDNIRSVYNTGAIFRTADAIGINKIFLIGTTPTPLDRFGRARKDFAKCALGSEKTVVWEYRKTLAPLIKELKKDNVELVALEQSPQSVDYKQVTPKYPSALIVGNEVTGISKSVLSKMDKVLEISMRGTKESLNVSVATGIVLFSLYDTECLS